ncbi:hypothetical protein ACFW6S_32355 [Streptomyces sp. NPDC058740]|uniref:hypothetical protein n=1 Tax=Streptomyces sp. NPDC058740 TaxID=3346619 RepID=UPI0036B9C8E9
MITSGRSRATWAAGWGMVLSGAGAVGCSLAQVSPYPPLTAPLALAGLSVLCATAWVIASHRSTSGRHRNPQAKPYRETRRPNRVLRYVLGFGVAFATTAAFLTLFTESSAYGREGERLERVGYGAYKVGVVRLAGEPRYHEEGEDNDAYYTTDLTLRIPYASGPREVTVRDVDTRLTPPVPGRTKVEVHFAPLDPEVPVTVGDAHDDRWAFLVLFAVFGGPWVVIVGGVLTACMDAEGLHRLRRFEPHVHLPALGILLAGVVLLLPVALEFEVAGHDRLPAAFAFLAPPLAFTWLAKRS